MDNYCWGIDLGGTKIECAIIDKITNECVLRKRTPTETSRGYDVILSNIKSLIDTCAEEIGYYPKIIGFGTPGALDPASGTMKNCNTTCLNGKPLDQDLRNILNCEIKLANDAKCFALAEANMGAVPEVDPKAQVVFGVILGTGVGGGVVVDGKIVHGKHGIGGEWGHNVFLPDHDVQCYCGKYGCLEQIIAGPSLERYYFSLTDKKLKLKDIIDSYRSDTFDEAANLTVNRLLDYFSLSLSYVLNLLDPDVVVIGGGVGNVDEIYSDLLYEKLEKLIFNEHVNTKIIKPSLGDSAGVFGAALLIK